MTPLNVSFYDTYISQISTKLKKIDLLVKTSEEYISIEEASEVLAISVEEIQEIMAKNHFYAIDPKNFFQIMESGSSDICGLFRREKECGSPVIYTRKNIAYIYNIDLQTLNQVCDHLHIHEMTWYMLPEVFQYIHKNHASSN